MKNKKIICIIVANALLLVSCSDYDTYVNNNIRLLKINGIVINKFKEDVGCFGAIIVKECNKTDSLRKIFYCANPEELIWDNAQVGDSLFKPSGSLEATVTHNGHKTRFLFPTRY